MKPTSSDARPLRLFFPSAAGVITDHRPLGEGLISWHMLNGLAARGHQIVACVDAAEIRAPTSIDFVETGSLTPESLRGITRPRIVDRALKSRGGVEAFDIAHWLFPQDPDLIAFGAAGSLPYVIGPIMRPWPAQSRRLRKGDVVMGAIRPLLRCRYRRVLRRASAILANIPEVVDMLAPD